MIANGNLIYIVGGRNVTDNQPTDQLYSYDPVLRQFSQLAPMPEPRTSASAAIVAGMLYVSGGYYNVDDPTGLLPFPNQHTLLSAQVLGFWQVAQV